MYFDSHAHYDDEKFNDVRDDLLTSMNERTAPFVHGIINIGADIKSSIDSIELADKYSYIYAMVGVHPHNVSTMSKNDIEALRKMAEHKKVLGIGEIGLDYYYDLSPHEEQRYWFKRQLALAVELDLPVAIHSRDATNETFNIIKESSVRKGVIHAFSGSADYAKQYVELGFNIGIGGIITFKNARKLVEVVEAIPLERIFVETDSPYLSPEPVRGTINNSQNLEYICNKIGEIKQISGEKVAEITANNVEALFGIKKVVA